MKRSILLLLPFLLFSCSKIESLIGTTSSTKATVQFCSFNPVPYNGTINGQGKWDIWNSLGDSLLSTTIWDSSSQFVQLNTGTYLFKNYGISTTIQNDTTINYYDTLLSFTAGKVYSVFTTLGRTGCNPPAVDLPNAAYVTEETDTVSPANGFAKIRLIVGVPQLGLAAFSTAANQMHPALTFYNNNGDTLNYSGSRYYLDHLVNPALMQFKTVPCGNYNQLGNIAFPNSFAFNLQSGKKYTLMVTQMIRNQYPNLDHFYLVQHVF